MPSDLTWIYLIAGAVIAFVVLREFVTWYFKLDKIVSLLETQNALIEKLVSEKSSNDEQA
jgi:hypothetical protein